MNLFQTQKNLNNIELCYILFHLSEPLNEIKQLTSGTVFHNKNKTLPRLKAEFHFDYKRMITELFHDISLVNNNLLLFVFHNEFLINNFHCVKFPVLQKPC